MEVLILIVWLALCGAAAYVAENKGRSGMGIFFLSLFLSPLVGIVVAIGIRPDEKKIALAQGKKKCPNCAEFVPPDARACRFCQHSFVEEEAAERARREEERARLEAERAAATARQRAEDEALRAAEAAKPWLRRNGVEFAMVILPIAILGGLIWYGSTHQPNKAGHLPGQTQASEMKSAPPAWVTEVRSQFPKSVWDRRVAWAVQHHCYFAGMSRDEIAQAVGGPTEETQYSLTYRHQTKDCARYEVNGDACAEYKTEEKVIFLKDGYKDKSPDSDNACRTLYGEHGYFGLEIPDFTPP
jgi:hypothetical protein